MTEPRFVVYARTSRTGWIEMKSFDAENLAREYAATMLQNDAGVEVCITDGEMT